MNALHVPVMVEQVTRLLDPQPGRRIVDATTGAGGHAEHILEQLGSEGELIGLDRDPEILAHARERLQRFGEAVRLVHARLSYLREVVAGFGYERVDGVLMDLGVSSLQLDEPRRGFTFTTHEEPVPLDMRMDESLEFLNRQSK